MTIATDPGAFSSALVRYLRNPDLRFSSGKAAVELVKDMYDNRTLTAGLLEFYRKIAHDS
jgi:glycosyltransferase involved in cell wall biosynthesis